MMKNPYVLMCCLTAAIGGFSFGYGMCTQGPARIDAPDNAQTRAWYLLF